MSEVKPVHRYKAQTLFSFGGAKIEYFPHGPDVVVASEYDAQRLRADTAEAELRTERLRADAAVGDANEAERSLAAAEQRIAKMAEALQLLRVCALLPSGMLKMIDAALNPKPEGPYSDCATNNRGVPELLGPCDCGYEGGKSK